MLSSPTPSRPTTSSCKPAASSAPRTCVRLRTISASAEGSAARNASDINVGLSPRASDRERRIESVGSRALVTSPVYSQLRRYRCIALTDVKCQSRHRPFGNRGTSKCVAAGVIAIGVAVIRGGALSGASGWFAIIIGTVIVGGYTIFGDVPPFVAYLPTGLLGIVLLPKWSRSDAHRMRTNEGPG